MALTLKERQEFLAQPHIGALAVAVGNGRAPLNVPIWYQYSPGGELWVVTGAGSKKARALEEAGRFSIMAQVLTPSVRYVTAEGPVVRIEPMTDEGPVREMAERYLPADKVDGYLKFAESLGEQVVVFMRPEQWLSADMGTV
ncbi:pyridoxamine 5'-phosphate oxidase family protein [Nocardia sp. CDC153]|uniref:pyridoxamine 5'-phosphate oxidase family protein n=1 Tax=Nocardia sp. CDC153 TaxID=3112167 RepID=UPI002DBB4EAF|nr:pyridoxamine 5'-phosphate oxidase family protein [Nocardia sp. CDC153]MEC3954143.1 pyridoxamine 5'-phosphate oxidase family protein [Nocardia sp. CDC153]